MPCNVELGTWQLDTSDVNIYKRLTTTEGNTAEITQVGPIFTYELRSPAQVQPGDVIGVELGLSCSFTEGFDNVLSVNISGTGSSSFLSYRRPTSRRIFVLQPSSIITEQDYIPLIEAVVGIS